MSPDLRTQMVRTLTVFKMLDELDTATETDSSSSSSSSSEDDSSDDMESERASTSRLVESLLTRRYLRRRVTLPKSSALIDNCLNFYRYHRPDLFRQQARISPNAFALLVSIIQPMPCFNTNSHVPQIAIEKQLLLTLKRLGSYGNGSSLANLAQWAGVGEGTVDKVTRRVLQAVIESGLRERHVFWPASGSGRRERAKKIVAEKVIAGWNGGWCMIDGTLVPLYSKPHYFGERFFDRKSNYSVNVQVCNKYAFNCCYSYMIRVAKRNLQIINTPDLRIIDYSVGFIGSTPDATAWKNTRLAKDHESLLEHDEWCWADSGYPIEPWLITPYTAPASNKPDNKAFNYYFSSVRVGSEHAIGYLKGRFPSLRELRLAIRCKEDLEMLAIWLHTCIIIHSYAIDVEKSMDIYQDEFLVSGIEGQPETGGEGDDVRGEDMLVETREVENQVQRTTSQRVTRDINMWKGRALREKLKSELISSLVSCS